MATTKKVAKKATKKARKAAVSPPVADKVLFFTAAWCGPCQALHKALAKYPELVAQIEEVDIDAKDARSKALVKRHKVNAVPLLVRADGDEWGGWGGGRGAVAEFRRWLAGDLNYGDLDG